MQLNSKQLRANNPTTIEHQPVDKNDIYIILDNVLDTYNIGSIFRLSDAVAAKKIYLCGQTATPPDPRIKKASINTTEWVDWEYTDTTIEAIQKLREEITGIKIIAIEQDSKSISYESYSYTFPIAVIVGHETHGVSKEVLNLCDAIVEMPMFGINISLNVMVSLGIILYKIVEKIKLTK